MIDDATLDAACVAYEHAQAAYVRTPRQDPDLGRRCLARDRAYDRLVALLLAAGRVHHHGGLAVWAERGELYRAKIRAHRTNPSTKGASQ